MKSRGLPLTQLCSKRLVLQLWNLSMAGHWQLQRHARLQALKLRWRAQLSYVRLRRSNWIKMSRDHGLIVIEHGAIDAVHCEPNQAGEKDI